MIYVSKAKRRISLQSSSRSWDSMSSGLRPRSPVLLTSCLQIFRNIGRTISLDVQTLFSNRRYPLPAVNTCSVCLCEAGYMTKLFRTHWILILVHRDSEGRTDEPVLTRGASSIGKVGISVCMYILRSWQLDRIRRSITGSCCTSGRFGSTCLWCTQRGSIYADQSVYYFIAVIEIVPYRNPEPPELFYSEWRKVMLLAVSQRAGSVYWYELK